MHTHLLLLMQGTLHVGASVGILGILLFTLLASCKITLCYNSCNKQPLLWAGQSAFWPTIVLHLSPASAFHLHTLNCLIHPESSYKILLVCACPERMPDDCSALLQGYLWE